MIRRIPYSRGFPSFYTNGSAISMCARAFIVDTVVKYSWPAVKQCGFLLAE